jgi:hypothetical protein
MAGIWSTMPNVTYNQRGALAIPLSSRMSPRMPLKRSHKPKTEQRRLMAIDEPQPLFPPGRWRLKIVMSLNDA